MDKVRYGIIGIGNMGTNHLKAFVDGDVAQGELIAIADSNPQRIAWVQENYPQLICYDSAEGLINSGKIDAVIIAVPHYDHPALVISALDAGLHVMSEKPAGVYTKAVREMNAAAEKSNKKFGIMFQNRYNPIFIKMHDIVSSGQLGAIRRTTWLITEWYRSQSYYDSGSWRATWSGEGGGVLLNQCPHNLDLWQWIVGMMPVRIRAFCHTGKWHNIEVEDDVTAYVEYENGATGTFITSTGDSPGSNYFEIMGDMGKLVADKTGLTFYKNKISEPEFSATYKGGFGAPEHEVIKLVEAGGKFGHTDVLNNFTDAIINDKPLFIPGIEGIKSLTLSNAMHLSSWTDSMVELPLDEDAFLDKLTKLAATSKHKQVAGAVLDTQGTYSTT